MLPRRHFLSASLGAMMLPAPCLAAPDASVARRNDDLGPENEANATRVGAWSVTETFWESPVAAPKTSGGLVAHRRMIGAALQEILHAAGDADDVKRVDYLRYDRVEGRWDYVSLETRVEVGLMPAWSFGASNERGDIDLLFQPFAVAGSGRDPSGRMLRMRQLVVHEGADADRKDQVFALADGSGRSWLAHRYAYRRLA